jgi:hypothetical protein
MTIPSVVVNNLSNLFFRCMILFFFAGKPPYLRAWLCYYQLEYED